MQAIFATEAQADAARALGKAPVIVGATFHLAEDYHQKYRLRRDPVLMRAFAAYTPRQLIDSTMAARLNAIVAGHRTDLPAGLSPEAARHALKLVSSRG